MHFVLESTIEIQRHKDIVIISSTTDYLPGLWLEIIKKSSSSIYILPLCSSYNSLLVAHLALIH